MAHVTDYIRTIPDFPHEGIMFRDVTTLFADRDGLRLAIEGLVTACEGLEIDTVAGLEARGFILGGALADRLGTGFVPIRKKGKLPGKTIEQAYSLEYGEAVVEIHDDALHAGQKVLLVDDLLATGGTARATTELLNQVGANVVGAAFLIELEGLGGREQLNGLPNVSLMHYPA